MPVRLKAISHIYSQRSWLLDVSKSPSRLQTSLSSARSDQIRAGLEPYLKTKSLPALSIMPTRLLLRSLMATSILSSPRLLKACLPFMTRMANSRSVLLNPDKNRLIGATMRILFYNHFCAGSCDLEVRNTVSTMKEMGFKGVILGYAREVIVDPTSTREEVAGIKSTKSAKSTQSAIDQWREGNLRSLPMIGNGDFLAVKFTGAGPFVTEALAMGQPPPPKFWQSILEICDVAATQGTRVWIDAEQQIFQDTIDAWTVDLMRRYNRNGMAHIYITFQAYLKSTRTRIAQHLELAKNEGWLLGIKLVRGAYIASEPRHLIHDTKAETDAAYNSIARELLSRTFLPRISDALQFPRVNLFLAGHNALSVRMAYELHRSRVLAGLPTIPLEFGQLQGMADEVSCGLLQLCRQEAAATTTGKDPTQVQAQMQAQVAPRAFKCLAWGSTGECMQFLVRRAVENRGSMDRTGEWAAGLRRELWRRMRVALKLRRGAGGAGEVTH